MPKQARFKPMLLVMLAALGIYAYVFQGARFHASPEPCQTIATQTVPSPDAAWKAVITEYDCDGGFVSLTTAEYDHGAEN